MEQAAVKAFFTGKADELLDDKIYKLDESQEFDQGLFCHRSSREGSLCR